MPGQLRTILSAAEKSVAVAMLAVPSNARAGDVPVDVYQRPIYVAPYTVVVTPAHVHCKWRTVRVWTGYHYIVRRARHCW